nr:hypothetical protein BaRGS_017489 [Batillaria attramentaria]
MPNTEDVHWECPGATERLQCSAPTRTGGNSFTLTISCPVCLRSVALRKYALGTKRSGHAAQIDHELTYKMLILNCTAHWQVKTSTGDLSRIWKVVVKKPLPSTATVAPVEAVKPQTTMTPPPPDRRFLPGLQPSLEFLSTGLAQEGPVTIALDAGVETADTTLQAQPPAPPAADAPLYNIERVCGNLTRRTPAGNAE